MAEAIDGGVAEGLDVGVAGDVAVQGQHAAPDRLQLVGGLRQPGVVHVGDDDVGATPGQLERDPPADAAGAAGDDRDLALEPLERVHPLPFHDRGDRTAPPGSARSRPTLCEESGLCDAMPL